MAKSLAFAYLLLLLGGWLGLHHVYLERPVHAALWAVSGMCFGVGFLRDLYRMSAYVEEANRSDWYEAQLNAEMEKGDPPRFSLPRTAAQYCFGSLVSWVTASSLPLYKLPGGSAVTDTAYAVLGALGCAVFVWMVGGVGDRNGRLGLTTLAALVGSLVDSFADYSLTSVFAVAGFHYSRTWREVSRPKIGLCGSLVRYFGLVTLWGVLCTSGVYWHGHIKLETGEVYTVRESINNLVDAIPYFLSDFDSAEFFENAKDFNAEGAFGSIWSAMDPSGERMAYRTLGLQSGVPLAEVKKAHKSIALASHPDKVTGSPEQKAKAQERFIEAQQAYDTLTEAHKRRQRMADSRAERKTVREKRKRKDQSSEL